MIYGYIRVSTHDQAKSGLGLSAQRRRIDECAKRLRKPVARVFRDAAVSASRQPMLKRRAGWDLDQAAKSGDHVVIAKLDRAFRGLRDFAATLDRWHRRGVVVHLLDVGVDTSTPVGHLIAGVLATVAEWESRRMGERIREAHAERRAKGRKTNGTVAIGWKADRAKRVLKCPEERAAGNAALRLRGRGLKWREVAHELNSAGIRSRDGAKWTRDAATRWAVAAKHRFPITGFHGIRHDRTRSRSRR